MLTSKQRSKLKTIAAGIPAAFQVGKGSISDAQVRQIDDYLRAHEIIKINCLDNSLYTPLEAANELSERLNAEVVITIGQKAVLYRKNPDKPLIEL